MIGTLLSILFLIVFMQAGRRKNLLTKSEVRRCPDKHHTASVDEEYCPVCGEEFEDDVIDPVFSEETRIKFAEKIAPDDADLVTKTERMEAYDELFEDDKKSDNIEFEK